MKNLTTSILDFVARALAMNSEDMKQLFEDSKYELLSTLPATRARVLSFLKCRHAITYMVLQIVRYGAYRSVEHRAIVNSRKERPSIATFYNPNYGGDLGPAPCLITSQTPALDRRNRVAEYFKGLFARALDGKSCLDLMKIEEEFIN
ncbi:unnamed protein product [Thlaspi arvense]|uniref:Isopenicillin N synthase-like Fe(2+) 2OG dioxygenase domain-containing protein n=1 Tax=Thlaspi arvense TaxID=13288 RepID=A0AAU9RLI0_THLAR|nr:unnamed protein product [Thlaspi arvense]